VDEVIVIKKQEKGNKKQEVLLQQNLQQSTINDVAEVKNRQQGLNDYYLNAGDSKKYQFL
jgi:hypothetical protein